MGTTGQPGSYANHAPQDTYIWEVPGKPVSVHMDLDVVDRLSREVMQGFGLVPRRSVEVGGILLGSISRSGSISVVRIEDFEPVPCRHTRGASYLLSDEEMVEFEDALARWSPEGGRHSYAVGFYRSHTQVGFSLTPEDLEIYDRYFPDPGHVALLVKPFATRPSIGGFFFRENGEIRSESSYQEFAFRRSELGGEETGGGSQERENQMRATTYPDSGYEAPARQSYPSAAGEATQPQAPSAGKRNRTGWIWIPLSFIFLLLGVILGFNVALNVGNPLASAMSADPFSLHLTVSPSGDNVHVRWDRTSPAIKASPQGSLIIRDGNNEKVVNLDAAQLQNGSVIYRRATGDLSFRLEVLARDRVRVSESLDYRTGPQSTTP